VGAGVAAGALAGAFAAGAEGVVTGFAAAAFAARSSTEVGSTGEWLPRYANVKLVQKNSPAKMPVSLENKVLAPRAPNTVPEAPDPKPAPASAPLPRCMSTKKMIINASNKCTAKIIPRNIDNLSMISG
jgi:hypothetical protein